MSWLSLMLDGVMSALLLVMIVYCIKLNGLLGGLRERDAEIESLMVRFKDASDRAEQSVASLKAAGVEAERTVRAAIERARAVRDELVSLVERQDAPARPAAPLFPAPQSRAGVPPPTGPRGPADGIFPPELFEPDGAALAPGDSAVDRERSDAERDLLRAIRSARAGG